MKAIQVSQYVLSLAQNNPEEDLTNLKLQKILYYLQGYSLALYNKELFLDEIEPWKYGPVVSEVYHTYKTYGDDCIVLPDLDLNFNYLTEAQKTFINKVYSYFRQFSGIKLMEMTHLEQPWASSYNVESVIAKDKLKTFFTNSENKHLFKTLDKKEERKVAAKFLLADYVFDKDLTEMTSLDMDDFYEH